MFSQLVVKAITYFVRLSDSLDLDTMDQTKINCLLPKNLLEAKENKKSVLTEQKIIISRYSIISEGITSKSKRSQKDVAYKMLTEMISLRKQGFSEKLLMEEEKSFFSSMGSQP